MAFDWMVDSLFDSWNDKKTMVLESPDFKLRNQTIGLTLAHFPDKSEDYFFFWVENRSLKMSHFLEIGVHVHGENGKTGCIFSNLHVIFEEGQRSIQAGSIHRKSLFQEHQLPNGQHHFRFHAKLTDQDSQNESHPARSLSMDFEKEWEDKRFSDATLVSVQSKKGGGGGHNG